MKFGGVVATKIDDWQIFPYLEELGYDSAWAPDSQMIWSDCYATLALAAHHTSRIRLGTGVSIAGTRAAPVTAHSIATINKLAPGRTFLGIGTGHTAMRAILTAKKVNLTDAFPDKAPADQVWGPFSSPPSAASASASSALVARFTSNTQSVSEAFSKGTRTAWPFSRPASSG